MASGSSKPTLLEGCQLPRGDGKIELVVDLCPSDEELAAFVDGSAAGEQVARVEAHVDGCPTCHRVLAVFAHEGELRSMGALEAEMPRSGAAAAVVARLQALRPLVAGSKLGRFVVLEWIGEGAAGVVYAAYDPELDRKVALKLMHRTLTAEGSEQERARERVIEEARAMGKAAHPNVVAVHDVGTFEGRVFIAMEFVEGATLRSWVRSARPAVAEIVQAYTEAGRGLAAAHAAGVVHRDFKPTNVLRGDDGRVRVTDFGLARREATAGGDAERLVSGTPAYMAPEQLTGGRVDARSDQFAFCVALYEALYGEPPFTVPLKEALTTGARTAVRDPPAGTKVTPWTRRCVLRGLEPDPDDRHAGMSELLAALAHDPAVKRRRRATGLFVALLASGLLVAAILARRAAVDAKRGVCGHAGESFAALWNDQEAAALAATYEAVKTPYATGVWPRIRNTIDGFRAAWIEDRTRTCRAVLARSGASAVESDEHIACLDGRLREVRALLDALASVKTTEGAFGGLSAAASLPAVSLCDGAQRTDTRSDSPDEAARREEVHTALARADVLDHADRVEDAEASAAQAFRAAVAVGDDELLARCLLEQGKLANELEHYVDAERFLLAALVAAEKTGDDTTRASADSTLVSVSGCGKHDLLAARQWRDQALAIVQRLGANPHLEAAVHDNMGIALWAEGHPDEALVESRAAVAAGEQLGDSLNLSTALGNLALIEAARADFAASRATFGRAVEVGEQALGPDHPVVLVSQNNLATVCLEQLDFACALPLAQRDVAIGVNTALHERVFLATECEVLVEMGRAEEAVVLLARPAIAPDPSAPPALRVELEALSGRVYLGANRLAEARASLEAAVAEEESASPRYLAEARFALARTLSALRREPARARTLALAAAHGLEELEYPSPLLRARKDEVRAWLAANPGPAK